MHLIEDLPLQKHSSPNLELHQDPVVLDFAVSPVLAA